MRELWQRSLIGSAGLSERLRHQADRPRRPIFRPRLEPLESRTLLSAGDLDPTFGMGGKVTTDFPPSTNSSASSIAVQLDGKIVVAGTAFRTGGNSFALARYNVDGSLDVAFGTGGRVLTSFPPRTGSSGVSASGIALQPDGKILVAGTDASFTTPNQLVMARYLGNGDLDPSFGTAGQVAVDNAGGGKTVIQPDGKIVVAGIIPNPGTCHFVPNVARFNADGSLDTGFGNGGIVRGFGDPCPLSAVMALQPDGKIVLAGRATTSSGWVVRLTSSGAPDSLFGTAGKAPGIQAFDVALQPDGRMLLVGGGTGTTFDLARLNTTGAVDATFGAGGKVSTDFGPGIIGGADGVAIQPDGRIVVAGSVTLMSGSPTRFGLIRYNPNGSLDATFGVAARVTTGFDPAQASASGVVLQSDGRIVVAGSARPSITTSIFAVARYLGDSAIADANQRFLNQL